MRAESFIHISLRKLFSSHLIKLGERIGFCLDHLVKLPRLAARGLLLVYRCTFSALVGFHCRHLPSCSAYADEAISRFGLWPGGWLTLARLCRCHPFGTSGLDFVPSSLPAHARWYLPWRYGSWRKANSDPDSPAAAG
ncbi:MAG TPA: membrane protein insertion efficiency factor YidD [Xanthobacteraceae bacterium]|jgi:hypothetical protein